MKLEKLKEKIQKTFPQEDFDIIQYTSMKEPMMLRCNKCKKIQSLQRAENFFRRNKGCKNCTESKEWIQQKINFLTWLKSHQEFELIDDLDTIHKSSDYIKCKCTYCGRIQTNKTIYNYYEGKKCYCQSLGVKKPQDLINFDYKDICIFLEPYKSASKPVLLKNLKCFHEFKTAPMNLLRNPFLCPVCNNSTGEQKIEFILQQNEVNYCKEYNITIDGKKYRIDFYLPDFDLFIEYNGIQHYKPVEHFGGEDKFIQQVNRDKIVQNYFISIKKELLIISYKEFNDIEKILERRVLNE